MAESKEFRLTEDDEHKPATTRRSFYIGFIYAAWSGIGAALAIPAGIYLLFPPAVKKEADWIEASDLSTIPQGVPTEVSFQRKRIDGWKVISEKATAWIVRRPQNEVIAFTPQCTHLGCAYRWEARNQAFVCPCHSSEFSVDGEVLGGPAPRPLDRYQVKVEAGLIKIGPIQPHA